MVMEINGVDIREPILLGQPGPHTWIAGVEVLDEKPSGTLWDLQCDGRSPQFHVRFLGETGHIVFEYHLFVANLHSSTTRHCYCYLFALSVSVSNLLSVDGTDSLHTSPLLLISSQSQSQSHCPIAVLAVGVVVDQIKTNVYVTIISLLQRTG